MGGLFAYAHEKGTDAWFDGNIVHSTQMACGLVFSDKNNAQTVSEFKNFKAYKCKEDGLIAISNFKKLEVRNIQVADSFYGISLMTADPILAV